MISFISPFKIINVVILDPNIFLSTDPSFSNADVFLILMGL